MFVCLSTCKLIYVGPLLFFASHIPIRSKCFISEQDKAKLGQHMLAITDLLPVMFWSTCVSPELPIEFHCEALESSCQHSEQESLAASINQYLLCAHQ